MKNFRAILALLFVLSFCASSVFAKTVTVKQDGTGDATTIAGALALAVENDTIEIQQFSQDFDIGSGFALPGINLICTAASPAPLKVTALPNSDPYGLVCAITATKTVLMQNVKLVGRGVAGKGDNGVIALGGNFTMDKCTITDFFAKDANALDNGYSLWVAAFNDPNYGGTLSMTVTNSFIVNTNTCVEMSAAAPAGTILFDHCTFVVGTTDIPGGKLMQTFAWAPSNDLTETTFKNSLFLARYGVGGCFFPGAADMPVADMKMSHFNNAYLNMWTIFWGIADPGITLGATEIESNLGSTEQNGYPNYVNNDYTLPYSSPLRGKASDGGSIGADQGGLPATLIVVTHESVDTAYTDMPTARANFVPGDTMDIRAHEGPMPWSGNCPSWSTVKCTAATPATLIVDNTDGNSFGSLDHNTISNLIIDGGSTPGNNKVASCFSGGIKSTVTDCTIKGFWWNPVYITAGDGDEGATFTNCYISNTGSCVSFNSEYIGVGQTCTNKVTLNHCTLVSTTSWPIDVDANYAGKNYNNIFSIRNTILSAREPERAIIYNAAIPAGTVIDEDYNLFDMTWMCFWAPEDTGIEAPAGSHSVKFDSATDPANEIFADYANGDYRLKTSFAGNPCFGTGQNGSDIGAFQVPVPNAARQWNLFE